MRYEQPQLDGEMPPVEKTYLAISLGDNMTVHFADMEHTYCGMPLVPDDITTVVKLNDQRLCPICKDEKERYLESLK
jgi:hypothetical protein